MLECAYQQRSTRCTGVIGGWFFTRGASAEMEQIEGQRKTAQIIGQEREERPTNRQ